MWGAIGLKPVETEVPKLARVFYDFKDFQMRLAQSSPAHYDVELAKLDSEGQTWVQKYRIYGADCHGNLIVFERRWIHSSAQANLRPHMIDVFVTRCVRP